MRRFVQYQEILTTTAHEGEEGRQKRGFGPTPFFAVDLGAFFVGSFKTGARR
jgi:hypothetical protein